MNLPLKVAILASERRQGEVAEAAGINESRLSQIVRGRVLATDRERAGLAAALNVPTEALFGNSTGRA